MFGGRTSRLQQPPSIISPTEINAGDISRLASLPWELQLLVMSHMKLRDILRLRKTCRLYYYYLTERRHIMMLFAGHGWVDPDLLHCCVECFDMLAPRKLVLDEPSEGRLWRSMCLRCWRVKRNPEFYHLPERSVTFVDGSTGAICDFCDWPVSARKYHQTCHLVKGCVITFWASMAALYFPFVLGSIFAAIVGTPSDLLVLIPALATFLLMFACILLLSFKRTKKLNFMPFQLFVEVVSAVVWILTICALAQNPNRGKSLRDPLANNYILLVFTVRV
ncbi:hypothetical protein AAE478_000176 [Parahypoxylon ruwenzoriense]